MIDKVKLIEKFLSEGWSGRVVKIVENFAEESEIDFDRLRNKFGEEKCNEADCHLPMCNKIECYTNFLKSKHLSASKPKQLPVKKTWMLKKEYEKYSRIIGHTPTTLIVDPTVAPDPEFYDYKEEPDYSKIPKGSIVVVCSKDDKIKSAEIVEFFDNSHIYCNGGISYELKHVKIRIVELAKE